MQNKQKLNLYYILYFLIIWPLAIFLLPSSETIRSVAKILIFGIPLIFLIRKDKILIFKEKKAPLNYQVIIKYLATSILCLLVYVITLNKVSNYDILRTLSVWFVINGLIIAPIIEETVFRGYFLQKLQNSLTFWKANLIQGVLFLFMHIPLWLARGTSINLLSCSWILIFGTWLGFVKKRTNWLGAAIILHFVGNLLLKLFLSN